MSKKKRKEKKRKRKILNPGMKKIEANGMLPQCRAPGLVVSLDQADGRRSRAGSAPRIPLILRQSWHSRREGLAAEPSSEPGPNREMLEEPETRTAPP